MSISASEAGLRDLYGVIGHGVIFVWRAWFVWRDMIRREIRMA